MKFFIVLAIVGCAVAQQQLRRGGAASGGGGGSYSGGGGANQYSNIETLRQEYDNPGDGTYRFAFETSDGTLFEESGQLKPPNQDNPEGIQETNGQYKFIAPDDGQTYSVSYVANELGYQPTGSHLPTPPPIPPEIARALEILFANAGQQRQQQQQAAPSQQQFQRQSFSQRGRY